MRRVSSWVVALGAIVMLGVVASDGSVPAASAGAPLQSTERSLAATGGWVKMPAPGETTTTAFFVVENPTMYAIDLVSAASDVAGKVEFHDATKPGNADAQEVAGLTVPAYDTVYLNPKGLHLVLMDLKRPLKEGDTVRLMLTTDLGDKLDVSTIVRKE